MKINNPIHKTPTYKKQQYNKMINEISKGFSISLQEKIDKDIIQQLREFSWKVKD